MNNKDTELLDFDRNNVWHPYTSMSNPLPSYLVKSAQGVHINLASGESLVDGMSSWWAVLHGYNHPRLNDALVKQSQNMSHVMFGGLTHEPAINLCKQLIDITPAGLDKVFLSDSGSVAVEVAIKMAFQYWISQGNKTKNRLMTFKNGYHGDTFATMAVCDPVNGMHHMFEEVLTQHIFVPAPYLSFHDDWHDLQLAPKLKAELAHIESMFAENHQQVAAFILEPIVQGAGGMRFYHPEYLKTIRHLCDKYEVLFIADEIATGLGRTGKLFACEWANISPDIMCLGKTLTAGYLTLAATLCKTHIAKTISDGEAKCFMHGPTYMGNPLACALANENLSMLANGQWQENVKNIAAYLTANLLPLVGHSQVANARVMGSIGVIESLAPVNMEVIQKRFVELGVWIRPFGKLIYIMPPYIINEEQLEQLIAAIKTVLNEPCCFQS